MGRLLLLFIVGFIGLSLRYIILGKFELNQLLLLLLFPLGAVLILFIMKWQYNKDRDFRPRQGENDFITQLSDRISTTPKKMYRDDVQIGSYHRFYKRRWQRIVADILDSSGQWYLNLSFSLLNGDQITFINKTKKQLRGNREWVVYYNNKEAGTIKTDYSVKKSAQMKHPIILQYGEEQYQFLLTGLIGAETKVYNDDSLIATGNRLSKLVYQLAIKDESPTHLNLLFMVYILTIYEFNR